MPSAITVKGQEDKMICIPWWAMILILVVSVSLAYLWGNIRYRNGEYSGYIIILPSAEE